MDIEKIKADYHLFVDVQMEKYLKKNKKTEFSSENEARLVIAKIIEAYNTTIAPEDKKLDNYTLKAKRAWFNSVNIDFGGLK